MEDVNERIYENSKEKKRGEKKKDDKIKKVEEEMRKKEWVMCLDEFEVKEIEEEMIM